MSKIQDTKYEPQDVLGLIAGEGRLPFLVAAGAKQAGLRVICQISVRLNLIYQTHHVYHKRWDNDDSPG